MLNTLNTFLWSNLHRFSFMLISASSLLLSHYSGWMLVDLIDCKGWMFFSFPPIAWHHSWGSPDCSQYFQWKTATICCLPDFWTLPRKQWASIFSPMQERVFRICYPLPQNHFSLKYCEEIQFWFKWMLHWAAHRHKVILKPEKITFSGCACVLWKTGRRGKTSITRGK